MYLSDPDEAAAAFVTEGLLAGTLLATEDGWCDVAALQPGDWLLSAGEDLVEVRAVQHGWCTAGPADWPEGLWPLEIPKGALGNGRHLRLLPEQQVRVLAGEQPVALPALALEGRGGIFRSAPQSLEHVVLVQLEAGAMICAEGGLQLYCPPDDLGLPPGFAAMGRSPAEFVPMPEARALIQALDAGDAPAGEDTSLSPYAALRAPVP